MLMCLMIATAALLVSTHILMEGHTTIRLRGGGQVTLHGWVAYVYAINGLVFGASTLCFALVFGAAGLGPQRWGRAVFPLLGLATALFFGAAIVAAGITLVLLIRTF